MKKLLIVYKSKTGFTQRYAQQLAKAMNCEAIPWEQADEARLAEYERVVFGTRAWAGKIDGWAKARKRLAAAGVKPVLFLTGATPIEAKETVDQLWQNNLTPEERQSLPHFYLQSGLCYEKMGFVDRSMMKVAAKLLPKQAKEGQQEAMSQAISHSFDASSEDYLQPLIDYLKQ